SPRLLPTAHALIALKRSRIFRGSEICESILDWLCDAAKKHHPMAIHEAAMTLLVLIEYEVPGVQLASYHSAREELIEKIVNWSQTRSKTSFGEIASYHFWVQNEHGHHNHYFYYVPDILTALSLLRAGNPRSGRARVTQVVEWLC